MPHYLFGYALHEGQEWIRKWSFKTLQEAIDKRDALFAVLGQE